MTTDTMNLDALSEPVRCAVLTERLPKELRERGAKVLRAYSTIRGCRVQVFAEGRQIADTACSYNELFKYWKVRNWRDL